MHTMEKQFKTLLLLCLVLCKMSTAFVRQPTPLRCSLSTVTRSVRPPRLRMWSEKDHRQNKDRMVVHGIKGLLTQRAIQTQLFYWLSHGDATRATFLEKFGNHTGLRAYHGVGAMSEADDDYLARLSLQPPVQKQIRTARPPMGTPGNPFIKPTYTTHEIPIEPLQIVDNLLDIRQQLSVEWIHDLGLIQAENDEIWRHHSEMVANLQDNDADLQFPILGEDPTECQASPLRVGSYDLLQNQVTLMAMIQLMARWVRDRSKKHELQWLNEFYMMEGSLFQGDNGSGCANTFLCTMLSRSPIIRLSEPTPCIIDPLQICTDLMEERALVALKCIEIMETVPQDRTEINRKILEANLLKTGLPLW